MFQPRSPYNRLVLSFPSRSGTFPPHTAYKVPKKSFRIHSGKSPPNRTCMQCYFQHLVRSDMFLAHTDHIYSPPSRSEKYLCCRVCSRLNLSFPDLSDICQCHTMCKRCRCLYYDYSETFPGRTANNGLTSSLPFQSGRYQPCIARSCSLHHFPSCSGTFLLRIKCMHLLQSNPAHFDTFPPRIGCKCSRRSLPLCSGTFLPDTIRSRLQLTSLLLSGTYQLHTASTRDRPLLRAQSHMCLPRRVHSR